MIAKKFELGMYCLGNGITVCNNAVEVNGDYKQVAHITNGGNIHWYVSEDYVPDKDREVIYKNAEELKTKFRNKFELYPVTKQYCMILDRVDITTLVSFLQDKRPLEEKIVDMRKYFYTIA